MSIRKNRRSRIITNDGSPPQQAVIGVPRIGRIPTPESARALGREEGRAEGRKALGQDVEAKIDQVRADAQALERTAKILNERPRGRIPLPQVQLTADVLHAMAEGMRLAVDMIPDSREPPF
jgi:hypothetical protein